MVVATTITLVLISIAWVIPEFTQNQPTEDTVWNRLNDFVRTHPGNLRPVAPRTGQRLGSNGHEVGDALHRNGNSIVSSFEVVDAVCSNENSIASYL